MERLSGASNGAKKIKPFDEQNTNSAAGQKVDYKKMYPQAGQRSNEGQRQMKERLKHGNMHLHYGYEDTPAGKAQYKKDKKEYDLY